MFESFNKSCSIYIKVLYKTRKTAALGGVSLVHRGAPHLVAFLLKKKSKNKFGAPALSQMVLQLPQGHVDSLYVLSFEIGQRESVFYRTRTGGRTDRWTDRPYYNIDIKTAVKLKIKIVKYEKAILLFIGISVFLSIKNRAKKNIRTKQRKNLFSSSIKKCSKVKD